MKAVAWSRHQPLIVRCCLKASVDKTTEFRQFSQSFGQRACAFDFPQKLAQWRAPRPPQRAKTSSAFLFCELFSLHLWCQRKKWLTSLCNLTICLPLVYTLLWGKLLFKKFSPTHLCVSPHFKNFQRIFMVELPDFVRFILTIALARNQGSPLLFVTSKIAQS